MFTKCVFLVLLLRAKDLALLAKRCHTKNRFRGDPQIPRIADMAEPAPWRGVRLGVALHCAPARPPEDRWGVWGGGLVRGASGVSARRSASERFLVLFAIVCDVCLFVFKLAWGSCWATMLEHFWSQNWARDCTCGVLMCIDFPSAFS